MQPKLHMAIVQAYTSTYQPYHKEIGTSKTKNCNKFTTHFFKKTRKIIHKQQTSPIEIPSKKPSGNLVLVIDLL